MTREIPLSRGMVALVDDEDYDRARLAGTWTVLPGVRTSYAKRDIRHEDGQRSTQQLHTFLTGWSRVDHINGDGLDCRMVNLRRATHAENVRNAPRRRDNSSGFKGVSWEKARRSWRARISHGGRKIHLGLYPSPEDAARAYDDRAREFFGEFATLNFPRPGERAAW